MTCSRWSIVRGAVRKGGTNPTLEPTQIRTLLGRACLQKPDVRKLLRNGGGEVAALCSFMQIGAAQHDVRYPPRAEQSKRLVAIDGFDHTIVTTAQVRRDFNARRRMRVDKKYGARLAATGEPNDVTHDRYCMRR